MRRTINKEKRLKVYRKYNGHCAYCGKEIDYKAMQVDHFWPLGSGGSNEDNNLMPACRRCNHYKRDFIPEVFRRLMVTIHHRILKIYIVKVAVDFGIVKITPFSGKFYYEQFKHEAPEVDSNFAPKKNQLNDYWNEKDNAKRVH